MVLFCILVLKCGVIMYVLCVNGVCVYECDFDILDEMFVGWRYVVYFFFDLNGWFIFGLFYCVG